MFRLLPLLFLVSSCTLGPGNFQSSHSTDLEKRHIRRIAVLPLDPVAVGGGAVDREVAVRLSDFIYTTMVSHPQWQIISDREVLDVLPLVPRESASARAKKLGELVYADAVISGRVLRYRERVGEEWGAKSPASVALILDLWDTRRGDLVWSGRFDETQKALSENIFSLGEFAQRGAKWLKAEELAQEGIKKAVGQLHRTLYRG